MAMRQCEPAVVQDTHVTLSRSGIVMSRFGVWILEIRGRAKREAGLVRDFGGGGGGRARGGVQLGGVGGGLVLVPV